MKNIKIWIGLTYLLLLSAFLFFLFSKISFHQITDFDFIKSQSKYLINLRESNLFIISIIFILLGCLWISVLQGIGSIIFLTAGFLFGVYFGTVISVLTLSLGSSLTYIFANFFFKDLIKEKLANRFIFLKEKAQANEFFLIMAIRLVGGTPLQLQNLLPILFNAKLKNYFYASFLGFIPPAYIFCSLGSGLENQIKENLEQPSFLQLISSPEIYGPIIAFFFLLILAFFLRKKFYKN
tara:strand:- start:815 stop:1528 length:714 start_codon:yes stop_codon:yes gene_type:complete